MQRCRGRGGGVAAVKGMDKSQLSVHVTFKPTGSDAVDVMEVLLRADAWMIVTLAAHVATFMPAGRARTRCPLAATQWTL